MKKIDEKRHFLPKFPFFVFINKNLKNKCMQSDTYCGDLSNPIFGTSKLSLDRKI